MKKTLYVLIIGSIFLFFACNQEKSLVVGDWTLKKMMIGSEEIPIQLMANPTYSFAKNHTYMIKASGQTEEGKWKIEENTMFLTSKDGKEVKLSIKELNEKLFIYEITGESVSEIHLTK